MTEQNTLNKELEFKEHLKCMTPEEKLQFVAEEVYDNRKAHEQILQSVSQVSKTVTVHDADIKLLKKSTKDNKSFIIGLCVVLVGWIGIVVTLFTTHIAQ